MVAEIGDHDPGDEPQDQPDGEVDEGFGAGGGGGGRGLPDDLAGRDRGDAHVQLPDLVVLAGELGGELVDLGVYLVALGDEGCLLRGLVGGEDDAGGRQQGDAGVERAGGILQGGLLGALGGHAGGDLVPHGRELGHHGVVAVVEVGPGERVGEVLGQGGRLGGGVHLDQRVRDHLGPHGGEQLLGGVVEVAGGADPSGDRRRGVDQPGDVGRREVGDGAAGGAEGLQHHLVEGGPHEQAGRGRVDLGLGEREGDRGSDHRRRRGGDERTVADEHPPHVSQPWCLLVHRSVSPFGAGHSARRCQRRQGSMEPIPEMEQPPAPGPAAGTQPASARGSAHGGQMDAARLE